MNPLYDVLVNHKEQTEVVQVTAGSAGGGIHSRKIQEQLCHTRAPTAHTGLASALCCTFRSLSIVLCAPARA
eukprot:4042723-Pleurochrysis_carterae.AAC.2